MYNIQKCMCSIEIPTDSQTSNSLGYIWWVQAVLNASTIALPPNNITKFPSNIANSDCESHPIRVEFTPVNGRTPKVYLSVICPNQERKLPRPWTLYRMNGLTQAFASMLHFLRLPSSGRLRNYTAREITPVVKTCLHLENFFLRHFASNARGRREVT